MALALVSVDFSAKSIWIPHEGNNKGIYPGKKWQKTEKPENLGWSSAKLAEARNFSKKINSAAVVVVGSIIDRVKKQMIKDKQLRNKVMEIKKTIIKS